MSPQFEEAIRRIDEVNAGDPVSVVVDGERVPKTLAYGRRMTEWLSRLSPGASEALRLAARAQHIARWEIPRESYPKDRIGYLKWRTTLYSHHGERAGQILQSLQYDSEVIERVRSLLKKERLKADEETQTLEDVICLAFLEMDFVEFVARQPEEKVVAIVQKTWKKMSDRGHEVALQLVPSLPMDAQSVLRKALTPNA